MADSYIGKGLEGVIVEKTELSRVDGEKGELIYRGYDIDEAAKCSYEEICYLFLYGELPTTKQLEDITDHLVKTRKVSQPILDYVATTQHIHPMDSLRTAVSMLTQELEPVDDSSPDNLKRLAIALVSKTATIAAAVNRARSGLKAIEPNPTLGHAANYLFMSRGKATDPSSGQIPESVIARTLDIALVLHADHGFNASTFTTRVVASSLSDMLSSVTAAIGSLKGSLHGGANTDVMNMLLEIGSLENVEPWVLNSLENKKKIPGFGHRVYKVFDPRAKHLKEMSKKWGERVGNVKWFDMSEKIEEIMHKTKKINANVDFYSASTYYAMGIKPEMFTVIFAVSRMLGWVAHYIEQIQDNRLMRPEALYVGPVGKHFIPISERLAATMPMAAEACP